MCSIDSEAPRTASWMSEAATSFWKSTNCSGRAGRLACGTSQSGRIGSKRVPRAPGGLAAREAGRPGRCLSHFQAVAGAGQQVLLAAAGAGDPALALEGLAGHEGLQLLVPDRLVAGLAVQVDRVRTCRTWRPGRTRPSGRAAEFAARVQPLTLTELTRLPPPAR